MIAAAYATDRARRAERLAYLRNHHDPQVIGAGELLARLQGENERLQVLAERWADDPDHEYYGGRMFDAINDEHGWDRPDFEQLPEDQGEEGDAALTSGL